MAPKDHGRDDSPFNIERAFARLEEALDDVKTMLSGPPDNPQRGIIVRVDRLEESHKVQRWLVRAVLGAAIAITVEQFYIHVIAVEAAPPKAPAARSVEPKHPNN